jgi:NAD(P)-dependent dehydrogenase (short-subunit alcohol dehydrogenase family)
MPAPSFDVSGKQVIVTGGRGGIGRAIGEAFRAHGARVILTDVSPSPAGDDGFTHKLLDVCDDAAIARFAAEVPKLDVLVQCAGKINRGREYEIDAFRDTIETHLFGSFRLANAFRPQLAAARGCIVNIASMYSFFGSPHAPAYGTAKAALVQLTKSLALAWAKEGIRVNAIAPGWITTELTRGARENPEFYRKITERLPDGRFADPEDVAGPVVFLASEAAKLITGVTIPVDGGYSAS